MEDTLGVVLLLMFVLLILVLILVLMEDTLGVDDNDLERIQLQES